MIKSIFTDFRTVLIVIIISISTLVIAYSFKYLSERYIKKRTLTNHIDPTSYVFARKVITAVIYLIGISRDRGGGRNRDVIAAHRHAGALRESSATCSRRRGSRRD